MLNITEQLELARKFHGVGYGKKNNSFQALFMRKGHRLSVYSSRDVLKCAAAYDAAKVRYRKGSGKNKIDPTRVFGLNLPYLEDGEDRDEHVRLLVLPMSWGGVFPGSSCHPILARKGMLEMMERLFAKFRDFDGLLRCGPVNRSTRPTPTRDRLDNLEKRVQHLSKHLDDIEKRLP